MRRVTFKLHKSGDRYHLMLNFNHDQGRFRRLLGIHILPADWSADKMRVKGSVHNHFEINRMLDLYEKKVMDLYYRSVNDGFRLTASLLRQAIAPGVASRPAPDLLTYFQGFIDARARSGKYAHQSIKNYRSFHNILTEYEGRVSRIHFDSLDIAWLEALRFWLVEGRGLAVNTVAKHFRILSAVLNSALRDRIPVKTDFQAFRQGEIVSHNIYLSLDELARLEAAVLSDRLRNAVDIFLIGCFTALRYSDFSRFRLENIRKVRDQEMIFIKQQKTGDEVVIPLHPAVRRVIDRNGGRLPRMISGQKLNDYIKEACRLAGITDKVVWYYNRAGKNVSEVVEKWELVSSHTARRSAATNMHIAGVDSRLIMRLTGHRKESTFNRYIRIDNEEAALLLGRQEFFK